MRITDTLRRGLAVVGAVLGTVVLATIGPAPVVAAPLADGPYSYVDEVGNRCMDVEGWGVGPNVLVSKCHGGSNQRWLNTYWGNDTWTFEVNDGSQRCLDAYRGYGQRLAVYRCDGTTEQRWFLPQPFHDGRLMFENLRYRDRCADVEGSGRGPYLILYNCFRTDNQLWNRTN